MGCVNQALRVLRELVGEDASVGRRAASALVHDEASAKHNHVAMNQTDR